VRLGRICGVKIEDIAKCPSGNILFALLVSYNKMVEIRTPHGLLHGSRPSLGNGVPKFGSTKVDVIDAEQIHILDVPSKRGSPHPKVEVWCINTWQTLI
jgi:hypothetical protein